LLEAYGYKVERTSRGYAVDGVLRVDRLEDGHWVACDHYGNGIGDNIDLVRHLAGEHLSFAEAVFQVTGGCAQVSTAWEPPKLEPPRLPAQTEEAREKGREYLASRGISGEAMDHAERAGALAYSDGAVFFVGRNAGTVRAATARATDPAAEVQRRDLKGTDKKFPPVLPGNPGDVALVEGGADALALYDLARRRGKEPPTVVVTGGAGVRRWAENDQVRQLLEQAARVVVWRDVEDTPEKQQETDAAHERQADAVREIAPMANVELKAPAKGKDLAAWNQSEVLEAQQRQAEEEARRQAELRRQAAPARAKTWEPPAPGM